SQARQSRWYCRNRWESRSVPFFTRKPLLETVKGFLRLDTSVLPLASLCLSSVKHLYVPLIISINRLPTYL
ncbi:hypothetical protein ACR79Q_14600, partial [Sphingobacterium multivorum]|uniref:hypothetical protein n=1 Tax=Sphingobacterium multivorum TaxID=28454 RepID=UPI003DA22B04